MKISSFGLVSICMFASLASANYKSSEQEYAPVQVTGSGIPSKAAGVLFIRPSVTTATAPFAGRPGYAAGHEGRDYIHTSSAVTNVAVRTVQAGKVVYTRTGCSQSSKFSHNNNIRECGAGWGNHVVISHGGFFTRYAHLEAGSITVSEGQQLVAGQQIAIMGNSGRSEFRHMHFELGTKASGFKTGVPAQSFDRVYNPEGLKFTSVIPPLPPVVNTELANYFEMHRRERDKMPSITAMNGDTALYTRFYTSKLSLIKFVMAFKNAEGIVYNRTNIDPLQDKAEDLPIALEGAVPPATILDYNLDATYFILNSSRAGNPFITVLDSNADQAVAAKNSREFRGKTKLIEFLLAFPNAHGLLADDTENDIKYVMPDIE